ncbi:hypothetical protein IscW_ISCW008873 [Ixodes scapularis]|uniref:Uncharacterized protein n=1 Tax=Ixodes scapularis TaxID=6945 RepID=B7Q3K9_IXOSC|nr:hypothetical protein IscW_ISCW008873 [Ixodes scapularis]|eukprot:XP_002411307.1 hypothetical protein IscW_ISCW008873 [Ixodes scapularis]
MGTAKPKVGIRGPALRPLVLYSGTAMDTLEKSKEPGRAILRHVGYDTDSLPQIPLLSLEETTIQLTTLAPLPRNMGKDYEARRQHRAREHEVFVKDCKVDTTNLFVYTDATGCQDDQASK